MWLTIGASPPSQFYRAVLALVNASRAYLYASYALFTYGVLSASFGDVGDHMWAMTSGLISFYFSVMYIQLPGFIGAVPRTRLTIFVSSALAFGIALSRMSNLSYLPFSILYSALYARGLRPKPNFLPNYVAVSGLLLLPFAETPTEGVLAFPFASILTLMYRIDSSRRGYKFSAIKTSVLLASYIFGIAAFKLGILWASTTLPLISLAVVAPPVFKRDIYAGVFIGRVFIALLFLHRHFLYMGFAVVMVSLCVPFFIASILYRELPKFKFELLATALVATALRLAGQIL